MQPKPALILAFAIAFALFIIGPALLSSEFPAYSLIHWGDVFDLLTPLVMIPLYWLLFLTCSRARGSRAAMLLFLLLAALWVEGQGMHLAANSISNLLGAGSQPIHDLVHFLDEVLSHYLWHFGIVGLSALLLWLSVGEPAAGSSIRWPLIAPAAVIYGLTYFLAINEGGTVPLGMPAAAILLLWPLLAHRAQIGRHGLVTFFTLGYALATALFLGWYLYWGGFPEFTEVGLL